MNQLLHQHTESIVSAAIHAVLPDVAVVRALQGYRFGTGKIVLVAAGKAAWQMANAASDCLGDRIADGVVVTKYGHIKGPIAHIRCFEGGHPVPDDGSCRGTQATLDLVQGLTAQDTVVFLLSGGGSALLEKPLIPLDELQDITQQLLGCGADIVTHSTTKYMDGHGATLGGAIVDGGKFDWMAHADKFPGLCTPDDSYHGITYAEHFGKEGAFITKATAQLMRDFGCVQSPINAYMLNLGLESLHVRMARHCENGQAVAEFLASHPKIAYVNYCGLPGDKYHAVAEKYLPNGSCGVVSFGVKGGREAAAAFMGHLKIAAIETHVADARTCCLNPASSTHRQMNDEQLKAAGVPAELVRMSCGLESSEDLIADIAQALDKI